MTKLTKAQRLERAVKDTLKHGKGEMHFETKPSLNKAREKRLIAKLASIKIDHTDMDEDGYNRLCSQEINKVMDIVADELARDSLRIARILDEKHREFLKTELAREREKIKERAEKVVKELNLPKDYLDFMSAVFFVKLPSETKITKHDKEVADKLSKQT